MPLAPFPIDPHLTGIVIAYRNNRLIADELLPRVPVGKAEFKYLKHSLAEGFTVPDTKVGRLSSPNRVEFTAEELAAIAKDHGLDDVIPHSDIANADSRYNPVEHAALSLRALVALGREKRVADLLSAPSNYGSSVALTGGTQWTEANASVNPIDDVLTAMDGMLVRPNRAWIGRQAFSKLRIHPRIVEAVKATGAGVSAQGIVTAAQIAEVFELDALHVGEAFINTANKGQSVTLAQVWGKHMGLFYSDPLPSARALTYGFTGDFGGQFAGTETVTENAGLRGGTRVRVGESVGEVISAPELGHLFQNIIP